MIPVVLQVDDSDVDAMLLAQAWKTVGNTPEIVRASDGKQALDMLADGLAPSLVLLDLNMPGLSGMEVLERIRGRGLANLPVIIFSTSQNPEHVALSKQLGASGYECKPGDFGDWLELLRRLTATWLAPSP